MILSSWGSAWGTWRAGLGVCHMGIDHPAGIIKNIVPIVMAGVLGIYGLIVSVIITQSVVAPSQDQRNTYSSYNGYTHVRFIEKVGRTKKNPQNNLSGTTQSRIREGYDFSSNQSQTLEVLKYFQSKEFLCLILISRTDAIIVLSCFSFSLSLSFTHKMSTVLRLH